MDQCRGPFFSWSQVETTTKRPSLLLLNKYSPDSDKGSCPVVHSVAWCDRITFVCWKLVTKFCCCLPEVETCKMYTAELTCTTLYVCMYICSCHAITTWETCTVILHQGLYRKALQGFTPKFHFCYPFAYKNIRAETLWFIHACCQNNTCNKICRSRTRYLFYFGKRNLSSVCTRYPVRCVLKNDIAEKRNFLIKQLRT